MTVLHVASKIANAEVVKILLNATETISKPDLEDFELIEVLFTKDNGGNNALHTAARRSGDNSEIIKELLSRAKKISPDKETALILSVNGYDRTALDVAASVGNYEAVKLLLDTAEKNSVLEKLLFAKNDFGHSALHSAALLNDNAPKIIKELLARARKISPNKETALILSENIDGCTAFHLAAQTGKREAVKSLLDAAETISVLENLLSAKNIHGNNVLHIVARRSQNNTEITKELLTTANKISYEHKTELILSVNNSEENVLVSAALGRNYDIVKTLLDEVKADFPGLKKLLLPEKMQPLLVVAETGYFEVAKELLNFAKSISSEIFEELILSTHQKYTALHVAARCRRPDVFSLLLTEAENDKLDTLYRLIFARDGNGKSAVCYIFQNGDDELFKDAFNNMRKHQKIQDWLEEELNAVPHCRSALHGTVDLIHHG